MFRSLRKILKDEEITISYIDPTQSFEERQKALYESYIFVCKCCRCTEGYKEQGEVLTGNSSVDAPIHLAKLRSRQLLDGLVDGSLDAANAKAQMQNVCDGLSPKLRQPITTWPIPNFYHMLAKKYEDNHQWEEAMRLWLYIVYTIDPLVYRERINPHRVAHLMSICQLEGY